MSNFDLLLSPITIGGVEIPNRVLLTPMGTEMCTKDGLSTPREAAYYGARAKGGTGLVMTGINFVAGEFDPIAPGLARIDTDDAIPGIKAIVDAVHTHDSKFALQLTAGLGRNNQYCQSLGMEPRSSSDNTWFFDPTITCRPLEIDEIQLIVQRMEEAARRAAEAGVDIIDIHGHTGYLIDQFMSQCWNRRTDQYGGPVENRCRFASEIIQAAKRGSGGRPVSFRISVDHRFPGGRTAPETREIVVELEKAGVDLILCDDGSYEAFDYVFPPYYLGDNCMVSAAETVKPVVSVPVAACGNITPANGEKLLEAGVADMIAIGRGLIADPDIVNKLRAGRPEDVRPCIRCNQMCTAFAFNGAAVACAVNPEVGFELERIISPAVAAKKVVVVGAGPGGLEAARVAGLRGHSVDVYDREDRTGGVLFPAATPDFKRELRKMIDWWDAQLADIPNVRLHLGQEITAESPELGQADAVVLATGSHPILPASLPGIDRPEVVEVMAAHTAPNLGKRLVVCGGGLSGADFALEMAEDGHEVTVVEMLDEIARDMLFLNRTSLLRSLGEYGVAIHTGTKVTSIEDDGVHVTGPDGDQVIPADNVVIAFGVSPASELTQSLGGLGTKVVSIGDCVNPGKVGDAINAGYLAGLAI